jgi:cytochrome d ubiquinol oxidase subunit I
MIDNGVLWHRIQFVFTVSFHYLFPQLTMGLALLIVTLKVLAIRRGGERYNETARFWARILAWITVLCRSGQRTGGTGCVHA